jgi:hypothetical protein
LARKHKPSVQEIVDLRWEMQPVYSPWHAQQEKDDKFYELLFDVVAGNLPDGFEAVIPNSASTIVDLTADHAAGNFPQIHVPRRKETAQAQDQSTVMERFGQGFWYRNIQKESTNILRAWALSGGLRGAVAGCLVYDPDAWPDMPVPSEHGGSESDAYKEAKDEVIALRRSSWPLRLTAIDPLDLYPDPASDGKDWVIHAYLRKVYDVVRDWPNWDRMVPGRKEPLKLTDTIEFIAYADDTYRAYLVSGDMPLPNGNGSGYTAPPARYGAQPLNKIGGGVQAHGYGFNPYFFGWGGFGKPFGAPEHKGRGILSKVTSLLAAEARRMTHLDAIVAQQAFPWILVSDQIDPNMELGGTTRVPMGQDIAKAVLQIRTQVPIAEIAQELQLLRGAIQRGTIPDSLGAEPNKSEESGYLRSLKIGTGRAKIRALTNTLERASQWATSGSFRLVENKVKGPVSVWGRGMGDEQEFITLRPEDVKGHYEVWVTLTPNLPNDESVDIANGLKLYEVGAIPIRSLLEDYAGRENSEELLRERLGEDVLKSPQMMQQLINDALQTTSVTGGPMGTPGFTSGELGLGASQPVGPTANPQSMAGVGAPRSIPTPPNAPGSVGESNAIIGQTSRGGAPVAGPLAGIQRGRA